jgi:hypothetical protein
MSGPPPGRSRTGAARGGAPRAPSGGFVGHTHARSLRCGLWRRSTRTSWASRVTAPRAHGAGNVGLSVLRWRADRRIGRRLDRFLAPSPASAMAAVDGSRTIGSRGSPASERTRPVAEVTPSRRRTADVVPSPRGSDTVPRCTARRCNTPRHSNMLRHTGRSSNCPRRSRLGNALRPGRPARSGHS